MRFLVVIALTLINHFACATSHAPYFDTQGRTDVISGGVRMISIKTSKGIFKVWTKRIGNNPTIKVLLLHGGPGITHEYALKYQKNLKGLIISNMMSSVPAYNAYAKKVLMPSMNQQALEKIKKLEAQGLYESPEYMELLKNHYYIQHIFRMPADQWPEPVERSFKHLNSKIYIQMNGPSELGASGTLRNWDRSKALGTITVPTLIIGARYDTMDPVHMKWMATQVKHGRYLYCAHGSHLAMYDDQSCYFNGLIQFLKGQS